jgi:hypothetical protein
MIDKTGSANKKSELSQKKISAYADKSEKIYDEYVRIQKELAEQKSYNKQLSSIVATQKSQIPLLQEQLKEIEVTNKKIIPLMLEMVDNMEKFVSIDTPFLKKEREQRAVNLRTYLSNPELSTAEQFRMILESHKIEYGYARTLEAYRSELDPENKKSKMVDFLRVGRLALYYQSLDSQESGIYDLNMKKWVVLDKSYNELIKKGIKMARKKISPDFLTLAIMPVKEER